MRNVGVESSAEADVDKGKYGMADVALVSNQVELVLLPSIAKGACLHGGP